MKHLPVLNIQTNETQFKRELGLCGWRCADSYARYFDTVPEAPGVYLLIAYDFDNGRPPFVAYAGMSLCLARRLGLGHEIINQITDDKFWPQRWFCQFGGNEIRAIERAIILTLNPPYNIIGRKRGIIP